MQVSIVSIPPRPPKAFGHHDPDAYSMQDMVGTVSADLLYLTDRLCRMCRNALRPLRR